MSDTCPHCFADLQGNPIPEQLQEAYGGHTHFSRKIGISDGDTVYEYECPDCSKTWPRTDPVRPGFRTMKVEVR